MFEDAMTRKNVQGEIHATRGNGWDFPASTNPNKFHAKQGSQFLHFAGDMSDPDGAVVCRTLSVPFI